MKKNASDYFIAALVVLCSLVLLGAITAALSGFSLHPPKRTLEIDFVNVGGIQIHSELRYAGAPAGRVKSMRTLSAEERQHLPPGHESAAVRVLVAVDDRVPPLGADTTVSVGSDTLLSEKYIALVPGKADAPLLDAQAVLLGKPGVSIDNLAESIGPLLENANTTIVELKNQIAGVIPKLGVVLDSTKQTSDSAQTLVQSANQLIKDNSDSIHTRLDELGKVMANLQAVLASTDATLKNSNQLVGHLDGQLDARMGELSVVLQNLKVVSTYAKSLTETLAQRPQALIFGTKPAPRLPSEAQILRSQHPVSTSDALAPKSR